jgi:hypothetical protein
MSNTRYCNKSCRTRRKIRRRAHCKTLKNSSFLKKIVNEWRKRSHNGYVKMDVGKQYTCDYYLSKKEEDYWNHVHLVSTVKIPKKIAHLRKSGYVFKKKERGRIIHSKVHLIDKKDNPQEIVGEMLSKYDAFI